MRGELHHITPSQLTDDSPPGQIQDPSIFDTDYSGQGGYKNIPPHHILPDFTSQQLNELFTKPGLKDIPLDTTKMRLPNNDTWTDSHTYKLRNWLAKRASVFSTDKEKLTVVKHYTVNIPHNNKPTVERIRPYTSIEAKEWNNYVESMRRNNLVEYCDSPWRSAAFLIRKPNGKGFRFVTDYRKANACVPRIHWPLVRADAAFTALGNAKIISSCDANSAYHQLPLANESSKDWTSFCGPTSQLRYNVLPQGYKNAVAEYSKFTSYILGHLQWQCCLTYLDDFIIFSNSFEDHLNDLDKVFMRLQYFGVQLSPEKSVFCQKELPYLGHIIYPEEGIRPNPKKTDAINLLPIPTKKAQLKSFIQMASYYRKFIPKYNNITAPLTDLLNKKTNKLTLNAVEIQAYNTIKQILTSKPVLALPNLSEAAPPFIILTDASKFGLGATLLQKQADGLEHPIAFISRVTQPNEMKYSTYELEAAALVWAIEVFKPYTRLQKTFIVRTDCQSLLWLMKTEHNTRVQKWIQY